MDAFTYHDIFETKGIEYLLTIVFFLLLIPFWLLLKYREKIVTGIKKGVGILSAKVLSIPRGLYYSPNHTWAHMEKSGYAILGVNDFLARVTGDVTVDYHKQAGDAVKKGDLLAEMTSEGKKLSIFSPVSGNVLKTNAAVSENPGLINTDPYGEGWVYTLEPTNWKAETSQFYFAHEATEWIAKELQRFKDMLASSVKNTSEPGMVVLQDGGEIKEHILPDMPESVWNDFQKEFMSV